MSAKSEYTDSVAWQPHPISPTFHFGRGLVNQYKAIGRFTMIRHSLHKTLLKVE